MQCVFYLFILKEQIVFKVSFYFFFLIYWKVSDSHRFLWMVYVELTWNMLKCSASEMIKLSYRGSYDVSREQNSDVMDALHTGLFGFICCCCCFSFLHNNPSSSSLPFTTPLFLLSTSIHSSKRARPPTGNQQILAYHVETGPRPSPPYQGWAWYPNRGNGLQKVCAPG